MVSALPAGRAAGRAATGRAAKFDGRGVAALGTADGVGPDPCAPGLQLVGRRGAERVGGAEEHAAAVGDEHPGQLAAGGRLAGPVHPDHHHDGGAVGGRGRVHGPVEVGAQRDDELLG